MHTALKSTIIKENPSDDPGWPRGPCNVEEQGRDFGLESHTGRSWASPKVGPGLSHQFGTTAGKRNRTERVGLGWRLELTEAETQRKTQRGKDGMVAVEKRIRETLIPEGYKYYNIIYMDFKNM